MSTVSSSIVETATSVLESATAKATKWYDTSDVQLDPEFLKYQNEVRESIIAFFTPLNITVIVLISTLAYFRLRTPTEIKLDPHRPVTFRSFTPRVLLKYNGHKSDLNPEASVYMAVRGKVYDVTSGRNFYGPGGPYENFAGRDATRGLACQSFDEEMLTKNLEGPLDPCDDLDADQLDNLKGWIERFDEKYLVVGRLKAYNERSSEF